MAPSSSSSALFHLICPKGIAGSWSNYCISGKRSARCCASWFYRTATTSTAVVRNKEDSSSSSSSSSSSPWLMLSPEFEGGTASYKLYSLAEKKVISPCCSDVIGNFSQRLTCRGSSHGWLALCSPDNDVFILYNPISRRHIKLPSVLNLPDHKDDSSSSSSKNVIKVILSCSPDDEEDNNNCRAVMKISNSNALAFCCPGRSKDWTFMMGDDDKKKKKKRYYIDCVYSTRRKVFFGLTMNSIETWDLRDPSSPRLIKTNYIKTIGYHYRYYNFRPLVRYALGTLQHLVVADQDLLFVIQHIMDYVGPDGSCFGLRSPPDNCRHVTIGFDIYKFDPKKRTSLKYLDDDSSSSLGGLAIFLGMPCHSVAIPATRFPELKPNSIYFTDPYFTGEWELDPDDDDDVPFPGHDIGIFSYEDKTVSPCYYPCDVPSLKDILPSPVWFFPSRPI